MALACLTLCGTVLGDAQVRLGEQLDLGAWSPTRTLWQQAMPVCIWNRDGAGSYRVLVHGATAGTQFAMTSGVDGRIVYTLSWRASGAGERVERLRPGIASSGTYAFRDESDCHGIDRPHLDVRVVASQMDRAPVGVYRDTLQLTVVPL